MGLIYSLLIGALALYGASQLLNRSPVYLAHRKIRMWAADPARMRHVSSCSSVAEWLRQQPERVLVAPEDAVDNRICLGWLQHGERSGVGGVNARGR